MGIGLALMPMQLAHANNPYVDGNLSVLRCADQGGLDFGAFLDAMIYNDDLKEGIVEPWNDILFRNQCHTNDVISLVKQQDKVRKSIRDAFLTCNTSKIPRLKSRFYNLTAEIYYARHIVDGGLVVSLPVPLLEKRFFGVVQKPQNELYNEMKAHYVGGDMLTQKDFDLLFNSLTLKYAQRIPSYISECKQGTWQGVADKWDEFWASGWGTKDALEKAGKGISARAGALAKEVETMEVAKFLNNEQSFLSYVGSFFNVNLNGLPPQEGLSQLSEALTKSLPLGSVPTQQSLLSQVSNSSTAFDFTKTETELRSKFSVLYLNASDEKIKEIMSYMDGRNNKGIDGAIESIEKSLPQMGEILGCVDSMNDRQCPGL